MTSKRIIPLSEYHRLPKEAPTSDLYKRLLEVVCNNATLALFIMDEHQECVYMNLAAEILTGYRLAETKGRALHDVVHHTRPDGRPYPLCECPIDQAFPQNNQEQGEEVFVHKDGHFYPVAYTASPIREGDRVIGTIIEVRDITQEKQAEQAKQEAVQREQALRQEAETAKQNVETILSSISDGVFGLDRNWCYTYVNDRLCEMTGKSRSDMLGSDHWALFPEAVGTELERQYHRAMYERVQTQLEYLYLPWDRWFECRVYPSDQGITVFVSEITDRQQAKVALQESERRFRRLVESNMFGVAFSSFAGGIHYANDYFLNMVGYSREEIESGQVQWTALTPPEFLPLDAKAGEELRAKGVCTPFEKEYIRKDGTHVPILIGGALLDKPHDQQEEIIAFYLDLTERKQVEAAWREGKQTLDALMEYIPEGITIADGPDVMIRQVSQYGQQLTGRSKAEITGIPVSKHIERWGLRRPDGTQPSGTELPLTRAVQQAEVVTDEEWVLQRPDGSQINILCNAGPIRGPEGNTTGGIIAWRDITERKQSEETLQQALQKLNFHVENTPMAVIEWDEALRITRWSGAAEQIFGWSAKEVLGTLLADLQLVVEDDTEAVAEILQRLREEPYVFSYNRNYTKNRQIIHCEWYNSSLHNEAGQMTSVLSLVLDVTDKKQAEAERERLLMREQAARAEAERANRVKDEFLAIVSHELRSPLNPILGWSSLLLNKKLDPNKTQHALSAIARNAKLQSELIADLLDISRILRGKLSLNVGSVDLVTTIKAAIETVRLAAEAKAIQIQACLQPDIGFVSGDSNRLQQVIWNLLSNAIKFTPAGGRVEVRLEQLDATAQIVVSDTGKGIHPEFLPYVFDYFRQEDGATTRKFGGLGLGLAIVHHLVELHGGTVKAESAGEGQGATFRIQLPLMPQCLQSPHDSRLTIPTLDLTGIQALIVDDDADTRDFVAFLLEQAGAKVETATSATEVLIALTRSQPDVLLSDIGMPEMDGYMLLRQIRALPPDQGGRIPAIALTAYAGEIDYQQAMQAGFQQHLAKPIDPQKLIITIANLVR